MREIANKYPNVEKIVEGYSNISTQGTSRVITVSKKVPKCDVGERCFYIIGYEGIDPFDYDKFMDEYKLESKRLNEENIMLNLFSDILNSIGYTLKKTDDKSNMFRNFLSVRNTLYQISNKKEKTYNKQEMELICKIRDSKNEDEQQQNQRKLNLFNITKERIIQEDVKEEFFKMIQEKRKQYSDVNKQKLLRILSEGVWYDFQNSVILSALEMKWIDVIKILIKSQEAKQKWIDKGISDKTVFKTVKKTRENFEKEHYHKYTIKMINYMESLETDREKQEVFIQFQSFLKMDEKERKAREKMIRKMSDES